MPREYKDCEIIALIDRFKKYIEATERPSVSGFAVTEFMCRETIYDWAKRMDKDGDKYMWPDLRWLLGVCKTKQRLALVEGGLDNKMNARIVSLCLQTNHDFVNRSEQQGNPERPLVVDSNSVDLSKCTTDELKAAMAFIGKIKGGEGES